jgi:hypothetical protein
MRRWRRIAGIAIAAVLVAPASASAATNEAIPSLANWGVWKSCGTSYPGQNCAQIRATAENPNTHTLYVVGEFTAAIDHTDTSSLPYNDIVAMDETTGAVVSSFAAHKFNGRIDAVAVDHTTNRVYVGGRFTEVDGSGVHAQHAAALEGTTGKLLAFDLRANKPVKALLPGAGILYVGGQFTSVSAVPDTDLAAVDPATGAPVATFNPPAIRWSGTNSPDVRALALGTDARGDRALYAGGHFDTVDGAAHQSVIRLDPTTGALDGGFAPALDVTSDDPLQAADGIAWVDASQGGSPGIVLAQAGHTNRAYRFDTSGKRIWYLTPDGDMQAVAVSGATAYFGGHFECVAAAPEFCSFGKGVTRVHIAAVDLGTGAVDSGFAPKMDPSNAPYFFGVWSVEVSSDGTLWAGGVFRQVDSGGKTYKRPKLAAFPPLPT